MQGEDLEVFYGSESVESTASFRVSLDSEESGSPGTTGTMGRSDIVGRPGTIGGLMAGPPTDTIEGLGCWNTQS